MKKLLERNYKNIGIFLLLLFLIASVILNKGLGDLDEIWNYNFARNIADGLIPYRDFNMLQMPLSPMIGAFALVILGNQLIVMRILAIFLMAIILFLGYQILRKMGISEWLCRISILGVFFLLKDYFAFDYNYGILAITLGLLYIEIKCYEKNKKLLCYQGKKDFFIGLATGCCVLLKQTTGVAIAAIIVGYQLIHIRKKEDLINFLKIAFTRGIGVLLPILVILVYLSFNQAFYDFVDYCILGIQTFSNHIAYQNLWKSSKEVIQIFSIVLPIMWIIGILVATIKKNQKLEILLFFGIASSIVIFPISDEIHFLIGMFITILITVYLLSLFIKYVKQTIEERYHSKKIKQIYLYSNVFMETVVKVMTLFLFLYAINLIGNYTKNLEKNPNIEHYEGIPISEGMRGTIYNIDSYILKQEEDIYILDSDAAVYMIPINRYHKNFDMFLRGNLGSKGEEGQIQKIKEMNSGTKILIKNEKTKRNWQNPEQVTKYIKENLNKIDQIEYFDVYEKIE